MFTHTRRLLTASLLLLACTAAPARADWLLTPFLGLSFGGDARNEHMTYGGSIAWMGRGAIGFELDASLASNLLNDDRDLDLNLGKDRVGTAMVNLIIGAPLGAPGVRPYATAGAGLMRLSIDSPLDVFDYEEDRLAVNVGAGLHGFVSERIGFRADVRYFRRLQDSDDDSGIGLELGKFNFWRGTFGLTLRF